MAGLHRVFAVTGLWLILAGAMLANSLASAATPTVDQQPRFPIRAAFYYPWFPGAWTQNGIAPFTHYRPTLGFYSSSNRAVIRRHIRAMQFASIDAGISSWWGPGSREDIRFPLLLDETKRLNSNFRWAIYYERESTGDPTPQKISSDLAWIKSRYGSSQAYLRINGRPVIFVYADGIDGCPMADRWKAANASQGFYVVLKVFTDYRSCPSQPDSWHQYAPAKPADRQPGYSYSISPGFWKADELTPRLPRDLKRFRQNVRDMVASAEPWQLVTTFNEWGEGTAIESAAQWRSCALCFGWYIDALAKDGAYPTRPPSPPPPPRPATDPVVAAAGDIASPCSTLPPPGALSTSDLLIGQGLAGVLTLGDNQYENGDLQNFQNCYGRTWGRVKAITFPSPGNHDPCPGSGYDEYFGKPCWYSFDVGQWHFVSLDSNRASDPVQLSFLDQDLATTTKRCVAAYWHHPLFSSGSTHGNQPQVGPFWSRLYNANADLVLAGHEHIFERFAPQTATGALDATRGIRQFTVGTGGRSLYGIAGTPKPNSEVRYNSGYGVLRLTLHANSYDWRFQSVGKTFTDSGTGNCH